MKKRCLVALLAILSLISGVAVAQTSSGSITGRVVDPSNAVVTGVQVTLTNQETGDVRTATTDKEGQFLFLALQPGTFKVSLHAEGFKRLEKRDLVLTASDRLSAGTLQLEVGAITQSTTVTAEVSTVQTETSERSAQIDAKEMSSLMSIGRDPLSLLRVLPGVVNDGGGSGGGLGTENVGYVAGVRQEHNSVSIDGVGGNPRGDGNKLDTPINMDSVQEIKVVLNSYQAEYGNSAGAIVNMTTKSGTQDFHGGAYYYGRNEAFNANDWLKNYNGTPRGRYRYNTYGFNVGGPVYVPKVFNTSKQKLFFFFSQEHWPTGGSTGPQNYLMPTAAERNGDFSKTYDVKGNKVYIADPLLTATGKKCSSSDQSGCFPGNIIPAARINANMQRIMNVFPLPTIDCSIKGMAGNAVCPLTGNTSGNPYNYSITGDTKTPSNQNLLRVDYNLSSKWHMYFRGMMISKTNEGLTSTTDKVQWGIPMYYKTPAKNAGINLTYIASSTLVNEFTVGYSSWNELNGLLNAADIDKLSKSALGVTLGQNNPAQNPLDLLPRITSLSSGGSGGTYQLAQAPSIDYDNRFPMNNSTGTWEFTDGLTKVWNSHTFKSGVYFSAGRYIQRHIGSINEGAFNFSTSSSNPNDTQYAYSNMLLGNYNSYQEGSNVVNYAPHWDVLEFYLQDTWKLKSNLTMNYGVRFTYDIPTQLQTGMGAGFVPSLYDSSAVPSLYTAVAYSGLDAAGQTACRGSYSPQAKLTRCAKNPVTGQIMPDLYIGTFASPFGYTGSVVNTDPNYPSALRYSNGLLPAPRFGISWDPFKDGKTAVRFGAGLNYNTREGGGTVGDYSLIAPLVVNSTVNYGQVTGAFAPGCDSQGNCYGSGMAINASPVDTRILQAHRKIESTLGVNFGIQRKIGFDTVVDVAYVGTFGRHLNQQINENAIPYGAQFNPNYDPSNPTSQVFNTNYIDPSQGTSQNCFYGKDSSTSATTFCQPKLLPDNLFRPYLGYQAINLRDYGSTSNYNALQTSVNRRFTKGLQFGASYTWSKTMTYMDTVNGAIGNFQPRRFWDYGEASFDRTHNLVVHWTANIPKASRLWNNSVLKAVGDNWEWSGIAQFVSGAPLSLTTSGNLNLTGGGDGARPFLVGAPFAPTADIHSTKQFINKLVWEMPCAPGLPAAMVATANCVVTNGFVPMPGTPGLTGLNIGRGPGTNNFDMALQKNIPVHERMQFTIRAEAFNVFNHVSFNSVDVAIPFDNSSSCGMTCGLVKTPATATFGQVNGERGARKLQLSARFTF
jgi:hypothetical protein